MVNKLCLMKQGRIPSFENDSVFTPSCTPFFLENDSAKLKTCNCKREILA